MTASRWVAVCSPQEIAKGINKAFDVEGSSVLLCRTGAGLFAVENRCTHQLAALEGGRMKGRHLFCPKHGVRFDLRSGEPNALTKVPIRTFAVREDGDHIEVELPQGTSGDE